MPDGGNLNATRRRIVWSLVGTVGLGSTGNIAAVTVGTIAARDIAGSTALSGAPAATVVLGAALGSTLLSTLMVRRGRRTGLAAGYAIGVVGALLAVAAVTMRSLPLLLVATVLIGFGGSSNQLSRYAAADMFPAARRGSAIATVVWGATIGAVVGPNLVSVAGDMAGSLGLPALAGVYLVPAAFVGLAALLCFALLRPDPYALAHDEPGMPDAYGGALAAPDAFVGGLPARDPGPGGLQARARDPGAIPTPDAGLGGQAGPDPTAGTRLRDVLRRPVVLAAVTTLVVGQVAMTVVMTMTPLHMTDHGSGLALVGLVISAHTFGMYALAPLSGRLSDRFGSQRVILLGLYTLAGAGLLAAAAPPDGGVLLPVALFLLGFGWNLGFVAGSNLLAGGLALAERTRLQGATDTIIWTAAAIASLSSGVIVTLVSYTGLGLLPAFLVMTPAWLIIRRRRAIARSLRAEEPTLA